MTSNLSESQNVIIGVIAAFVEGALLQPTVYWKNARAQKLPMSFIPSVIYRGTAASMLIEMQAMGMQFGLTGLISKCIFDHSEESRHKNTPEFMSGVSAGKLAFKSSFKVEQAKVEPYYHREYISAHPT